MRLHLHCKRETAYCGILAGLDAFRAAREVLVGEGAPKPRRNAKGSIFRNLPPGAV
jgi:hypothetical protein